MNAPATPDSRAAALTQVRAWCAAAERHRHLEPNGKDREIRQAGWEAAVRISEFFTDVPSANAVRFKQNFALTRGGRLQGAWLSNGLWSLDDVSPRPETDFARFRTLMNELRGLHARIPSGKGAVLTRNVLYGWLSEPGSNLDWTPERLATLLHLAAGPVIAAAVRAERMNEALEQPHTARRAALRL